MEKVLLDTDIGGDIDDAICLWCGIKKVDSLFSRIS